MRGPLSVIFSPINPIDPKKPLAQPKSDNQSNWDRCLLFSKNGGHFLYSMPWPFSLFNIELNNNPQFPNRQNQTHQQSPENRTAFYRFEDRKSCFHSFLLKSLYPLWTEYFVSGFAKNTKKWHSICAVSLCFFINMHCRSPPSNLQKTKRR